MTTTETATQYAVTYLNHYRDNKPVQLGNYDAEFDTADIIRNLRQQGFDPKVVRRTITRTYSDWETVG